ncbi:MAG: Panacea domain-containing protein [bacterium]|nr:Panacea domain-containing protein [bacterium]
MNKLEQTILYLLARAKEKGKDNLSKFELFKLLYLLEIESYKFTGKSFFNSSISFVRDKNGPISIDVYNALNMLKNEYINLTEEKKEDYEFSRHCISLKNKLSKTNLAESEKLFINSIVESYISLPIKELKSIVYATEPMEKMLEAEKKKKVKVLKGEKLDFNCITLDEDVLDLIAA